MLNLLTLSQLHGKLIAFEGILSFIPSTLVNIICTVSAILVIFFSTKYRNGEHKVIYYVLAVFFPIIALIVFAIKRKEMNGVGMKVCPSCHRKYPQEFVTCYQCNIELPPFNAKKKNAEKTAAIVLSVVFAFTFAFSLVENVTYIADTVITMISGISDDNDYEDWYGNGYSYRKGFKDESGEICYYDMKGNAYSDPDEVALYNKDGVKFVFSNATEMYQGTDGTSINAFNAYVDETGYIISLDYDELYAGVNGYVDEDGNKYYDAMSVSWDKDGKMITEWEE
ncbi:MAG: hypothetical protein NC122_06605 [Faecalibacterium sp.]|nr:hypothetical protein [Ruminococcus sp.]MCM1391498.1 hypothetical protein [Ruminococcus sp.]MCM1485862.1 hypothetical protein [Faecalibacterium sp.]